MIFIKNYVDELAGENFNLSMETSETEVCVKLNIDEEDEVTLICSDNKKIAPSIKSSLNYIASITNNVTETDNSFTTQILDNKPTEVAFFEKEKKIVLLDSGKFPVTVGEYDETTNPEKHYPRDMIVMICPKTYEGKDAKYFLVVDPRNIGTPVFIKDLSNCRIIAMCTKYPIWDKLKFPVYAYIKAKVDGEEIPVSGFKLGSTKVSKTFFKNVIEEVDINTAKNYLDESLKTLKPRPKKKPYNNNRSNNFKNNEPNSSYGNKSRHNNHSRTHDNRTGVPSKYGNKPFNKGNNR